MSGSPIVTYFDPEETDEAFLTLGELAFMGRFWFQHEAGCDELRVVFDPSWRCPDCGQRWTRGPSRCPGRRYFGQHPWAGHRWGRWNPRRGFTRWRTLGEAIEHKDSDESTCLFCGIPEPE